MLAQEIRKTLHLAIPVVIAQVSQMSMTLVDTMMVGRLGSQPLAAAALANACFFSVAITFLGILNSTNPMVSQAYGRRDRDGAGEAVSHGLVLALLLALPGLLLLRYGTGPFLAWIGQDPSTAAMSHAYMQALAWSVPPLLLFGVLRNFFEGIGRPRLITLMLIFGVSLNVAANWVLMYGHFGFPRLGLVGCGWATTAVYVVLFLAISALCQSDPETRGYRVFGHWRPLRSETLAEVLRIGWPIGASYGIEYGLFMTTAFLMGLFGTRTLAAHQVTIQCASATFMVAVGVSIATSVRVGHAVGRSDLAGARLAGWTGIGLGTFFMSIGAVIFWLFPERIVGLFLDIGEVENVQVLAEAVVLLRIAAVFQVFDGIQVTAIGALRGFKDTRVPMLLAMLAYWVVGMGSALWLGFGLDWKGPGLWWGLVAGLGAASLLLSLRFRRVARV